jgi:nicotinamidase-related amidase
MTAPRIEPSRVGVIVIDAQPLFVETMAGDPEPVLTRLEQLLILADRFQLPCLATFEHPTDVKGWLPERLERVFPAAGQRHLKHAYDCCGEPAIVEALRRLPVEQIVLAGAETDVCVMQSALGLRDLGYQVFLLEDCVFTSEPHPRPALERMYRAGVFPATYKMLYYELKRTTGDHPALSARRDPGQPKMLAPEQLPPWLPAR